MARVIIDEMGVTAESDLSLVTVAGRGLLEVPGLAMRAFKALSQVRARVLLISQASAECSLCFVTTRETAETVEACLRREFGRELLRRELAGIGVQGRVTLVTVASGGAGLVGQVLTTLGRQRVNVVAIAQGGGDGGLSLVVAEQDRETAVSGIQHLLAEKAGQPVM